MGMNLLGTPSVLTAFSLIVKVMLVIKLNVCKFIGNHFALRKDKNVLSCEDGDDKFSLEKDVIISTLKEEFKPFFLWKSTQLV